MTDLPTSYNNAVALWQRGLDTYEIAKRLSTSEAIVHRWIGWHLNSKFIAKGKPHGE